MIKISNISKNIHFDEPSHTYTFNGKNFRSITTVLSLYKPPFDPTGFIAGRCAKRDGITKEQVKQNWEKTKNDAGERGTRFHLEAEHFINTGQILDAEFKDVIAELAKLELKGGLHSEAKLFSEKYEVAGTADLIQLFDDNSFVVWDFKTNKEFLTKSKYKGKLFYPLNHIGDSHLETYSIQLWCYSIMLEDFGYKIKDNPVILWVNPTTRKIEQFRTLDFKNDALRLLKHYNAIENF